MSESKQGDKPHPPTGNDREVRVLVVDDDVINQRVAQKMLEVLRVSVGVVGTAAAAIEEIRTQAYDIVLMDCQMPGMNGYEATAVIRRLFDGKAPVIIAMTASAMPGDAERCIQAGMNDYLSKPVIFEELRSKIAAWSTR